jgi:hypothetical protein
VTTPSSPGQPLSTTQLPEYFAFQKSADATTLYMQAIRLVIGPPQSADDIAITNDDVAPTLDLRIDADTVIFAPGYVLQHPSKNVTIVARVVSGAGATIDVGGADGNSFDPGQKPDNQENATTPGGTGPAGTDGQAGGDGGASGNITIAAGNILGALTLKGHGGMGGRGQDGGDAGNGADGAYGEDGLTYGTQLNNNPTPGQAGGPGGRGGMAGVAGVGGAAGMMTVLSQTLNSQWTADVQQGSDGPPNPPTPPAVPGRPGTGGQGGKGGDMYWTAGTFPIAGNAVLIPGTHQPDGGHGTNGASGDITADELSQVAMIEQFTAGLSDADLATTVTSKATLGQMVLAARRKSERVVPPAPSFTTFSDYGVFFTTYRPPLTQLLLAFHEAKLAYLASDFGDAYNMLRWIWQVSTVPEGTPSQQMPPASELPQWTALNTRAATLLQYLAQGLDYFGNATNYAPIVPYKEYQTTVGTMLTLATAIETAYNSYTADVANADKQKAGIESALAQVSDAVTQLNDQKASLAVQQGQADAMISALQDEQQQKERDVNAADSAFQQAVEAKAGGGCSFADILSAITTLIAIGQDAFAAYKDVTDAVGAISDLSKISDAAGGVKTIISTVKGVASDESDFQGKLGSIQSGFSSITSTLTPPTPEFPFYTSDTSKLVIQEADFDATMQPFMDMPEAAAYVEAVNEYVQVVQARNQKILESDGFAASIARVDAEIADKQAAATQIQTQWATSGENDPTLAPFRAFMQGLYEDTKSTVLALLYEENQALNYWLLDDAPFEAADTTIAQLIQTYDDALTKVLDQENNADSLFRSFSVEDYTITDTDYPDQFATFRSTGHLTFVILPHDEAFSGYWNTRVSDWTIELPGVFTSTDEVVANLTHSGRASFLKEDSTVVNFSHKPLTGGYTYNWKTGKADTGPDTDIDSIALSPFTTWTLDVTEMSADGKETLNPGLELDDVHQVSISFTGITKVFRSTGVRASEATLATASNSSMANS